MSTQHLKIKGVEATIDGLAQGPSVSIDVLPRWVDAGSHALRCAAVWTTLSLTATVVAGTGTYAARRSLFLKIIRAPVTLELGDHLSFSGHVIQGTWKDLFDTSGACVAAVVSLTVQHDEECDETHD